MHQALIAGAVTLALASPVFGQTPQPFPRADQPPPREASPRAGTAASRPAPAAPAAPGTPAAQSPATGIPDAPSAAAVGFPVYPNAQFLASYDAGKGQRYYLYGASAGFEELVKYYQTVLKDRGARVYDDPGTHTFAQRFREETMAFPPGVTVKDWTSGGSQGYPNPKLGGTPERFPTVVMIVPPPEAAAAVR